MQNQNHPTRYNLAMRLLHWITGGVLLLMIASGFYMVSLSNKVPYKFDIYKIHKSIGIIIVALLIARIVVRLISKIPALPRGFSKIEATAAKTTHFLLYLGFTFVALSGFFMSYLSPKKALYFFSWKIPDTIEKNGDFASFLHDIHVNLPYWVLGLVCLHVVASIIHVVFHKKTYSFRRIW